MPRFKDGDRVQFTAETQRFNPGARSITGVVVRCEPNQSGNIRVRRDDLKTAEYWNEEAWELISPERLAFLSNR